MKVRAFEDQPGEIPLKISEFQAEQNEVTFAKEEPLVVCSLATAGDEVDTPALLKADDQLSDDSLVMVS